MSEWQWLISYSTALKTCESLTQRTELPTTFVSLHTESGQLEEHRNVLVGPYEPPHNLHNQKQRCRSAVQELHS